MSKSLLLTLGHGSSAILVDDGNIVNAYQNERISREKSDSIFPMRAIEELSAWDELPEDIDIYVSHWEPSCDLSRLTKRHWDPNYINKKFPKSKIISLNKDFTHHHAHAYSCLAYFGNCKDGEHIMVADGFGNYGEVFTLFEMINGKPEIVHKSFGYANSLGLLYQYATDYVGLKMNQDEWKLNAMATSIDSNQVDSLKLMAAEKTSEILKSFDLPFQSDPMTELGALSHVHKMVIDWLDLHFMPSDRPEIAYVLQSIVEGVLTYFLIKFKIKTLYCSGGVFQNVQLNGFLARIIPGKIGIMPLSGDEGCALGLFKYHNPGFLIPELLTWGKRDLQGIESPDLIYTRDLSKEAYRLLKKGYIVNVVHGRMEFGPRALCNTSTLAAPTGLNSKYINRINGRTSVMPMGPVMAKNDYEYMFKDSNKVIKSVNHMIMSLEYTDDAAKVNEGVRHYIPYISNYTGRPQLINPSHPLAKCIDDYGPLINTSFNIHGQPICWDKRSVKKAHEFQKSRDTKNLVKTLIQGI